VTADRQFGEVSFKRQSKINSTLLNLNCTADTGWLKTAQCSLLTQLMASTTWVHSLTHCPSLWKLSNIFPTSTTVHSILLVQSLGLTVFFHLCLGFLVHLLHPAFHNPCISHLIIFSFYNASTPSLNILTTRPRLE